MDDPLVGMLGFLGELLSCFVKTRFFLRFQRYFGLLSIFILIYFFILTVKRNDEWKDPVLFYRTAIDREPNGFLLYNNLGVLMHEHGRMKEAGQLFYKSIEVSPNQQYSVAYNNLGAILEYYGYLDKAIIFYKKSYSLNRYHVARNNLERLSISISF